MAKHIVKVIINIEFESELPFDEAMDELASECSYDFPSTDNVRVTGTEWLDTEKIN